MRPPRTGWRKLDKSIAELEEKSQSADRGVGKAEKSKLGDAQKLKVELDQRRTELAQAQRRGDLGARRRAGLRRHPGAGEEAEGARRPRTARARMVEEAVTPDQIAAGRLALDRHSGGADAGRRARQAAAHGGRAGQARGRPARGGRGRLDGRAACPRRPAGPEPADRLVHLPGPDRRRQDRARPRRSPRSCSTTRPPWSAST